MSYKYTLVSPCFFGMEKMLATEIKNLGFEIEKTEDGRITYKTDEYGIARANMWLRCAERVNLKIAEFTARSFEELYDQTRSIDWSRFIPYGAEFPVAKASSIKSKLYSTPDIQSIVKKAVVDSLKEKYMERGMLKEDKEKYPIYVFIHKDRVLLSIDTSGVSLYKRGYKELANKAPIRETLAAGLVRLTPWRPGRILVDPMCGSGTILIEAAMIGMNMAPGMNREFISEKWRTIDKKIWWDVRRDAFDQLNDNEDFKIYGYDIDPESIKIAKHNAEIAGVDQYIDFDVAAVKDFKSDKEYGMIITNPPYGERLEDEEAVKILYKEMGYAFRGLKNWSYFVITSYDKFEYEFGQDAPRKRKLYNGMLRTYYYQYLGPRPPKKE
ncbi:class I SAM-dependent RNA methyltransferase [Peptostreptococcus anaerobius]|uniref:THUMP domain-containing class I SAM-dependent RNA methyltransferase n=1 Tax=Peptostreptococcus anaerobius TaxID=1261 RepID=UPI00232C7C6C|nr:class I SAM-dependent RNA methyltransferase [Peptostreptococcus anaerobius]MDB8849963.1 class I SAM-dependent RNA methyltransferase [Peptostreptococcus anaerobius]MDB8853695.1 class I SAM-dependent RNA methyltransferase [Peptostreptococcus anaerobius]MDB8855523.1 class I SAM-dependent RNA methyltransferase [Peptostreptococcus anaerobius]